MTDREKLKDIIKNVFLQMEEAAPGAASMTMTGTTPGSEEYNTPKAFKDKKKNKNQARDRYLDPTVMNEAIDEQDWVKLRKIIRMEIAAIYFDLYKKRAIWMKS